MTINGTTRVSLSFSDWMKLVGLTATIVGGLIATLWRQEGLIRDVQTNQQLLEYRVSQLERGR